MSGAAIPFCAVDIYPYEGGQFTLNAGVGLLACTVSKNIKDPRSGSFRLTLAPGGPNGPEATPQWVDIVRPMSLAVITMQRAQRTHIVMIGLVTTIYESADSSSGPVQRICAIAGQDFSLVFNQMNYYGQMYFQFTAGAPLGVEGAMGTAIGLGVQTSPIDQAAKVWFNKIMAGEQGLLSKMNFAYRGSRVTFSDLMATLFGTYPSLGITLPTAGNFAVMSGSWLDTFAGFYPAPWFELFIATAEDADYGQTAAKQVIGSSISWCPNASPCLIARFTPQPYISNPQDFTLVTTDWDALPVVQLDTLQPLSRLIQFDESEVRNFFVVNPTYLGTLTGGANNNVTMWLYNYASWVDNASIERYGYRPFVATPEWFADPTGDAARSVAQNGGQEAFGKAVGEIALKAASFYEPLPLMASGTVTTNLRPDIRPGWRLQYAMTKQFENWLFYIDGITHSFSFGGQSTTTLEVCRGLPASVYDDKDLLKAMLIGNARRQDGQYQTGLPQGVTGSPLKLLNPVTGPALSSELTNAWNVVGQR